MTTKPKHKLGDTVSWALPNGRVEYGRVVDRSQAPDGSWRYVVEFGAGRRVGGWLEDELFSEVTA